MQRRTSPTGRRSPYPEIVDGYALPLEGPGLGIRFSGELAASKPFVPSLLGPRSRGQLNALLKARLRPGVGAGFLNEPLATTIDDCSR
jgi:hypothetical protein